MDRQPGRSVWLRPSAEPQPRLRLGALRRAQHTRRDRHERAAVHMPLIGTGQAGMAWPKVRDLILDEVVDHRSL